MSTHELTTLFTRAPFAQSTFEIVAQAPRCYWFDYGQQPGQTSPSGHLIGFDLAGSVYLARSLYPDKVGLPRQMFAWMANQSWLILKASEDDATRQYLDSRWPAFFDRALAATLLHSTWDEMKARPQHAEGRYVMAWKRFATATQERALWLCLAFEISPDAVKFTPAVELLARNNEDKFTGHPFQIWSDGVITKYDCDSAPQYDVPEPALNLLKYAVRQKAWTANRDWQQLLRVNRSAQVEIDKREFGSPGNFQGYYIHRVETNAGAFFLVTEEWGCMGEDGEAGDSGMLFGTELEARSEFEKQVNEFSGEKQRAGHYDPALGFVATEADHD